MYSFLCVARGQRTGLDTCGLQCADLIPHQRNQGRDHNSNPFAAKRRKLITQGFSTARWHNRKGVVAGDHGLHHFALTGAKGVKSENGRQELRGRCHAYRGFLQAVSGMPDIPHDAERDKAASRAKFPEE
jgi:hypothetical protein